MIYTFNVRIFLEKKVIMSKAVEDSEFWEQQTFVNINRNRRLVRNSLLISIFSILIFLVVDFNFFYQDVENVAFENSKRKSVERNHIFVQAIDKNVSIVKSVADSSALLAYVKDSSKLNPITHLLETYMFVSGNLMQISYLDETGEERIKFIRQHANGPITQISQENLQNKVHRYYFYKTKIARDKTYLSDIDLNIEDGRIEVPYKATYHIGKSILVDNKFRGMIVANFFAEPLLEKFVNAPLYNINLINSKGEIIFSSDKTKRWGFHTGVKDLTAMRMISRIQSGRYQKNDVAIYPLKTSFEKPMYIVFRLHPQFVKKHHKRYFSHFFSVTLSSLLFIFFVMGNLLREIFHQNKKLRESSIKLYDAQLKDQSLMRLFRAGPVVLFKWKNEKG